MLVLALCRAAPAWALDPGVRLDAYHHQSWGGPQGAPREIDAMAQTPDGWLWLGTTAGLMRFDGVRFEPFVARDGERLLSNGITVLAPHPNGELWIGYTFGGLSVLRDGRIRHVAPRVTSPVGSTYAIAFERDGGVWVASSLGLMLYRDGNWTQVDAGWGYPGNRAEYVYRDHYDRLWASDGKALYLLDRASRRFARVRDVPRNPMLLTSPDGRVWLMDGKQVWLLPAPSGGWRPPPVTTVAASSFQSLFDRDGNFWAGNCPVAVCVTRPADWQARPGVFPARAGAERFDRPWSLSSPNVHSMMQDREGNLWVGTVGGLDRFRHNKLIRVPFPPGAERLALAQDASGALWATTRSVGIGGLLWRIRDGAMVGQPSDQRIDMVVAGNGGTVLVAGERGIERRLGERILERYPMPPLRPGEQSGTIVVLVAEDDDSLWLGIGGRGVYRWHGGRWTPPSAHPQLSGLMYIATNGGARTWFGLRDNRVVVRDGDHWRAYGAADGVAVGPVRFIDAAGDVVISGDHGMAVLKGGRFEPIDAASPGLLANVSGLAVTADGDRWLNTNRGLLRVRAADWRRSMDDPRAVLRTTLWNDVDGYPGSAEIVNRSPSVFVARDGKVWVAATGGPAWFDPAGARRNALAPQVRIQAIHARGRSLAPEAAGVLAAGTDRLQIDYTALSYTMPERVRFRYRLLGLDADWQEVGTRRVAYYTNLGPGSYRFEVGAVNEDGVAGAVAATAPFEIAPRFYQTWWFALLCLAALAALTLLLVRLRLARVRRQLQARLEERLGERERIARTLHDTFLSSLQGLVLRLEAVAGRLAPGSAERVQVDEVLELADRVVAEGRDRVMDLRAAPETPGLAEALDKAAASLRTPDGAPVMLCAIGGPVYLPCALHDEVYHIGREAIANALRHANARRIEVEVRQDRRAVTVAIRDDGPGLSDDVRLHGRAGHWGLQGMRERAQRIGAQLAIHNREEGGLEVVLSLPQRQVAAQRQAAQAQVADTSEG